MLVDVVNGSVEAMMVIGGVGDDVVVVAVAGEGVDVVVVTGGGVIVVVVVVVLVVVSPSFCSNLLLRPPPACLVAGISCRLLVDGVLAISEKKINNDSNIESNCIVPERARNAHDPCI